MTEDSPLSETLTGEQLSYLTAMRKIEELLQRGFRGKITLNCAGDGGIGDMQVEERVDLRVSERRETDRGGNERRKA